MDLQNPSPQGLCGVLGGGSFGSWGLRGPRTELPRGPGAVHPPGLVTVPWLPESCRCSGKQWSARCAGPVAAPTFPPYGREQGPCGSWEVARLHYAFLDLDNITNLHELEMIITF